MKTLIAEAPRPFELTARYINAGYQPAFAFQTIDSNAGYDEAAGRWWRAERKISWRIWILITNNGQ